MIFQNEPTSCYITGKGERIRFYNTTADGHGGMSVEHREEMRKIAALIAEQKIHDLVPQMAKEIYKQSINDILKGIQYDIDTIVNIAVDDSRNIFTSSKARKVVSDKICNEIVKGLNDLELKL